MIYIPIGSISAFRCWLEYWPSYFVEDTIWLRYLLRAGSAARAVSPAGH